MANEKAKGDYKHWVGAVPKIENWYKNFNFVLVESMEDLESIFKDKKDYYMAFDTETTGLDFEEIDLVGYSFCLDGKTAYYVPVYHFQYEGNLGEESVKFIYERMCEAKKVFMYNMRYDARIMEYYGYKENKADLDKRRWMYAKFDMSNVDYYDVSVPVWLADTNQKYPSLKWSSLHFLGIEQLHFDEVIENAGSFFYLNPSENQDTVFYAAADALCTFLLATATVKYFTEAKHSAKFDNLMLYPLLHYENERIWLDGDVLKNLYIIATDRVDKMERDVYAMIGGQINLNSPVQVAQAFERLGIDTGERTSKGTMSVGIKILADLPKEYVEKFPALKSYINYKKTAKLISSYIKPLLKEYERRGYCRFAYKTTEVPTGRLACGKDGKNSFFSPINAQCVVGSSELFTDRGVKVIKDISVGDNVWDGESFRRVLNTYKNGVRDVYRVTLSNGQTLECTDKHQLYSATDSCDFRELKDLCVGDLVAFNSKSYDVSSFEDNTITTVQRNKPNGGIYSREYTIDLNNPRFWHFVGYFIGDGWYGGKTKEDSYSIGIVFNADELDTMSYIKETLDLLGIRYRVKMVNHDAKYKNLYNIIIKSVGISDMLHDLGIGCRAENKSIPEIVYGLSSECRSMLFRGLMDSDGKSMCHYEWSYCTVSKKLAYDVVRLATSLGINSHLVERTNGEYRNAFRVLLLGNKLELFNTIGVTSKYKLRNVVNESGEITLKSPRMGKIHSLLPKCLHDDVIKYNLYDDVSLSYYTKKGGTTSTYVNRCKFNKRFDLYRGRVDDFNFNVHWLKIKSIEYVGKEEVYDIHVDVTHRYCVNGFITHNSLPKPHVKMEDVFDLGDRNLFSKKDNIIMGYKFVYSSYDEEGKHIIPDDPTYIGWVEGMDDDLNIRMAISPKMLVDSGDDEFLYCSFDYAAEELRIAANLSREPNWVDAFVHGDDIHKRCYSLDTEFLTRDGWKTYEHIGIDTEIAQYNEDTKELEFVKAGHAYFNETDTMYHFVGNNTDLLVTPNHRMYDKGRDNWYIKRADELYKKHSYRTICSPVSTKVFRNSEDIVDSGVIHIGSTYHKEGYDISVDDFVELLGYVITDGGTCLRSNGSKTVYFSQSEAKPEVLSKMQKLNARLGNIFDEKVTICKGKEINICGKTSTLNGDFHVFSVTSSSLFDTITTYIGGNLKKDRVLSDKMLHFSDRLLEKFFLAMYDGDGLHDNRKGRENSKTILVQSKKLVEQLQLILINLGYSTNIKDVSHRYNVSLYKLNCVSGKRDVRGSNKNTKIIKYDEPVKSVCFAVPSSLLFVRRNGKTSVCGNTAVAIWGEEHYNRDYRKMAKYANFSILYGASSHSLYADSRYGFKSLQEAEDFYNKYKKALPTLFQWQDRLIYSARRKGMLQTFFGRPRRLRSYYENKQIGFANRSAGNTSVQGVAGDILKMVMIKLWRALFNNEEFKNDVAWRVAIHDEIGYTIRATKLMRILKIIKETQSVKLPEWPVEIITDPSVGWSMGRVYDFHMVEDDSELGYHFEPDLA